jgi:homoserine kinase
LRQMALNAGAIGFGISGSGPSVFALTKDADIANRITEKLQNHLNELGINSLSFVSEVNKKGPVILD